MSYINDFIRYETSFSILNALKRGELLTIRDIKSVLHEFVREGSLSDGSVDRFFNLKDTSKIITRLPGITLVLNRNLLDTLLVPTEAFVLQQYVNYYHGMADGKSMKRKINNPDLLRWEREQERESEERISQKMKKMFPDKFPN